MDDRLLWVWLTVKFKVASGKVTDLLLHYGSAKAVYEAQDYKNLNFLTPKEIKQLEDKSLDKAYEVCEKVKAAGARILVYDDVKYPDVLRHIDNPPYVLYVKGKIPVWDKYLFIGVIGTRKPTQYGFQVTRKLAGELAQAGVVVVTGLARGLDTAATEESIRRNVFTVGVIGSGIDVVYPPENAHIFKHISENGLLITECPPGDAPEGWHFPLRNRIIAGISRGVLVTQASGHSGTSITARQAMENGRDVYAVPGNIFEVNQLGTNRLIQSGAKCVWTAKDIIAEYPYERAILKAPALKVFTDTEPEIEVDEAEVIEEIKPEKKKTKKKKSSIKKLFKKEKDKKEEEEKKSFVIPDGLSDNEKKIVEVLINGESHKDDITRKSGIDAGTVGTTLIMLEMQGIVATLPGNKYKLK